MTGRNLCQIDLIADKKPRANKQLSIAKIKIGRVIAYSLKPQGKKSLSVCSTSWSVLRWKTLNIAAQMQLDFIHVVPVQSRLKRLSRNIGPDCCCERRCEAEAACTSLIVTEDFQEKDI